MLLRKFFFSQPKFNKTWDHITADISGKEEPLQLARHIEYINNNKNANIKHIFVDVYNPRSETDDPAIKVKLLLEEGKYGPFYLRLPKHLQTLVNHAGASQMDLVSHHREVTANFLTAIHHFEPLDTEIIKELEVIIDCKLLNHSSFYHIQDEEEVVKELDMLRDEMEKTSFVLRSA